MSGRPDVLVVGAGIVGAACARELAAAGLSVEVLERDFPGGGATATAMGHLVVMDDSEAQFALTSFSRSLWEEVVDDLPADCEDDPCGTLWLAVDDEELAVARGKEAFYRRHGVDAEVVESADLRRLEPELRAGLAGALRVPGDRVVYPPNAARWLLDRAVDEGARLRAGVTVTAIDGGSVRCGDEVLEAGAVVNAAGALASELSPELPIEPRKGHLAITDRAPGFCRHQVLELGYLESAHTLTAESVAFNVQPRTTGQLLIGSSRELVGWDRSLNRELLARMLRRAIDFLPRITALPVIRTWVGFRPTSPDHLPYVGRLGDGGPWVAAGHEGLGVTTAPGTGRLLADLILGRQPAIDPTPYAPGRLA